MGKHAYRVTIVVHSLNPGGAQQRLVTIANCLARRGAAVRFVAISGAGSIGERLDPAIPIVALKPCRKPRYQVHLRYGLPELCRELTVNKADLVLAGITTIHGVAERAVRSLPESLRPKLILRASRHPNRDVSHSKFIRRGLEPFRRRLHRNLYARADHVIAVAEDVAEPIRAMMPHPERITVIDNPVIDDEFEAALGLPLDHPWAAPDRDRPLLLAVGRLSAQKGFDILLDAFARLIERTPAYLVILGEGKKRAALEAQQVALGLEDVVEMPGHAALVAPWLARADVQVSSSRYEGAAAVLVEGLAAGCPMVVTDCPGNSRSLVESSGAGLVVPAGDSEALARGLDRALAIRWDRAAIRTHADRYRTEHSVDAYHRVLLALIGR